jgi:SAM-dependent methyltransferase
MPPSPPPNNAVGAETLERLAATPRFNQWMFDRIRRWVGRHVLEIGSGIGNLSVFLVGAAERVVLTDTAPEYLDRLRERFQARPHVDVRRLYLPTVDGDLTGRGFDTVVCLNVLEHVADDVGSLGAMRTLLAPRGRLVLLVPALKTLYGTLDEALGHRRRYGPRELRDKFAATGFLMRHLEYFNLAGIPGWWLTGRVLRRDIIPAGSLRWYDRLVPLFRLERLLPWRIGQSLIAIGEVPA